MTSKIVSLALSYLLCWSAWWLLLHRALSILLRNVACCVPCDSCFLFSSERRRHSICSHAVFFPASERLIGTSGSCTASFLVLLFYLNNCNFPVARRKESWKKLKVFERSSWRRCEGFKGAQRGILGGKLKSGLVKASYIAKRPKRYEHDGLKMASNTVMLSTPWHKTPSNNK